MAQFLRPDSVVSQGNWTGSHADLDETSPNDNTDRAYSQNNPNGSIFELGLSNPSGTPGAGTTTVRYRHAQVNNGTVSGTGTATSLDVSIYQGGTQIAADAQQAPGGAWTTRTWTPDMSSVTDWTDLRIRFVATGGGGSPANRRGVGVTWAELEVPDGVTALTQSSRFNSSSTFYTHASAHQLTQASSASNTQTFYAHTLSEGGGPQTLTQDSRFDNSHTFYAATADHTITQATTASNTATFYEPTVNQTLTQASTASNTSTFYDSTLTQSQALTQDSRFDNAGAFYAATADQSIDQGSRFDNSGTFYAAAIVGDVTITQDSRFDGSQTFYAATANQSVDQNSFLSNLNTFHAPQINLGLSAARFDAGASFYVPHVKHGVSQSSRFNNTPTFYAATLAQGDVTLFPPLLNNAGAGSFDGSVKLNIGTGRMVKVISNKVVIQL